MKHIKIDRFNPKLHELYKDVFNDITEHHLLFSVGNKDFNKFLKHNNRLLSNFVTILASDIHDEEVEIIIS